MTDAPEMIIVRSTASHGRVLVRSTDKNWVERQLRFLDREKMPYVVESPKDFQRIVDPLPGDPRG